MGVWRPKTRSIYQPAVDPENCPPERRVGPRPPATRRSSVVAESVLLLALGAEEGSYSFDAIRAMKGSFIVSRRGRESWRGLFHFRPYDYGPLSVHLSRSGSACRRGSSARD